MNERKEGKKKVKQHRRYRKEFTGKHPSNHLEKNAHKFIYLALPYHLLFLGFFVIFFLFTCLPVRTSVRPSLCPTASLFRFSICAGSSQPAIFQFFPQVLMWGKGTLGFFFLKKFWVVEIMLSGANPEISDTIQFFLCQESPKNAFCPSARHATRQPYIYTCY